MIKCTPLICVEHIAWAMLLAWWTYQVGLAHAVGWVVLVLVRMLQRICCTAQLHYLCKWDCCSCMHTESHCCVFKLYILYGCHRLVFMVLQLAM